MARAAKTARSATAVGVVYCTQTFQSTQIDVIATAAPRAPRGRWDALIRTAFSDPSAPAFHAVQRVVISLIFLSVASIILETVHPLYEQWAAIFEALEWVFLLGFGLEYAANIYVAENKRAYIFSFWGLIDLLAIIPSIASFVHVTGLQELRTLRVLRVLRTLKLIKLAAVRARESSAESEQRHTTLWLDIQIYLIALFTAMIISATLVFHAENGVPGSHFTNIPTALWYVMGIIATHGSPLAPQTVTGRVIAGVTMLEGVALFGILTNVIGRALLTSLFGEDAAEEDDEAERAAAAAARRRQLQRGAQIVGAQVAQAVQGVIASAGPLPSLDATPAGAQTSVSSGLPTIADPVALREQTSHGRPLTMQDSAYLLRSHVATEGVEDAGGWLRRLTRAAFVEHASRLYRVTSVVIIVAIFLSVAAILAESVEWVQSQYGWLLRMVEILVVGIFSLEYAAQVYIAENRRQYIFSFWGIVDLLSVLPSYVGLLNVTGLKILRTLRVLRVLRILKLSKTAALRAQETMARRRNTFWLDIQIYFIALFTVMILSATMMWYAEKDAASGFTSIPEGLWFAIITLTTTGSGAPIPVTFLGRVAASITMIAGIALFGVLTSVIGRTMLASLFGSEEELNGGTVETGAELSNGATGIGRAVELASVPRAPRVP